MSRAVTLANFASGEALTLDETNDRVGVASTSPSKTLDIGDKATVNIGSGGNKIEMDGVAGIVTATNFKGSFSGDITGDVTGDLTGDVTGDVTGNVTGNTSGSSGSCTGNSSTATESTNVTAVANNTTDTTYRVPFLTAATGTAQLQSDNADGLTYNPNTGKLSCQQVEGTVVTASQGSITSLGTLTGLTATGDINLSGSASGVTSCTWDASEDALRFLDNSKASFGTGNDLKIFHDGAHSIIDVLNDQNLRIVNDRGGGNEIMIECDPNGPVDLYYNGNKKLETTNSGLIVTGVCTAQVPAAPLNDPSGTYTLVASDAGKVVVADNTITVDQNVFSPGDLITVMNDTAGTLTLTQGSSVTLRKAGTSDTGSLTISVRGVITIICLTHNGFFVCGNLD